MWDVKNIVNQCVKCQSKFTSPEKPLKLLPCLHSMCLDCLYGRKPPKVEKDKKEPVSQDNEKDDSKIATSITENGTSSTGDSASNVADTATDKNNDNENSTSKTPSPEGEALIGDSGSSEKDDEQKSQSDSSEKTDKEATSESTACAESEDLTPNNTLTLQDEARAAISNTCLTIEESLDKNKEESTDTVVVNGGVETTKNTNSSSENETMKDLLSDDVQETKHTNKPVTECPVCRDPIEQPGISLMDNMFAALDPDQPLSPVADSKHVCTACDEGQQADSYCLQCEEWLCDSCVDAHKRVRITKDHVISPKDQVKVVTSKSPWEQLMTCKAHKQEQLKFFCEKCEKLTCRDCQLMDHKDHKYQFLDQAAEQYKARLKGSLALMGEKRNKLAASRDEISSKLTNCKEQRDTLQQEILKQADILVRGIKQAVMGVLSNLASFTDAATKRLNKEIDDVSDLVTKFDHCVKFMEDILEDGSSMSLLYSKGSVESKCRKVYHTQVDPQSLKGTLQIRYKHDVNWLLGSLNKIGAIYVNGVRYPPDKTGQNRQHPNGGSFNDQRAAGLSATSPHLQHMANQVIPGQPMGADWTKFIQTVSKPSGQNIPPNISLPGLGPGASLPPQLALPNRRGQASNVQPWSGAPPGIPAGPFAGHLVAGQLLTPQQQQQGQRPTFTPMRLHHRPATNTHFNTQNESNNSSMRSPPQYRMGGEASGSSRQSHGTPDPARPASAGMYEPNSRPDSGGSSMVDIKKEHRDASPDCVITSSHMKTDRPSVFQTTQSNARPSETMLMMQRNLDDVINAVPMDMSDNLEQIGGINRALLNDNTKSKTASPSLDLQSNRSASPTDEELRENWQGGNSMPGFSLSQVVQHSDPNDDYCACCHNGGDVLCCDQCPKVFHLQCHIPELPAVPSGEFLCTMCEGDKPVGPEEIISLGKRKNPGGLTTDEIKVCERVLLELICHPSSVPFQEPVDRQQVPNYYKIVTEPMDLKQIKSKLRSGHSNHYNTLKGFLYDVRQVFINCAIYNKSGSEVGKAGKIVRALFEGMVERLIPQYISFVKENPTPCYSAIFSETDGPTSPKRPKLD